MFYWSEQAQVSPRLGVEGQGVVTDTYRVAYDGHLGDRLPSYCKGLAWKREDTSVAAAAAIIMSEVFPCPVTSHDLPFPSGKCGTMGLGLGSWRSAFEVSEALAWLQRR